LSRIIFKKHENSRIYEVNPLHRKTKPYWRFLVANSAFYYMKDRGQGATNGTMWAGRYGVIDKYDYVEILKNIRYVHPKPQKRILNNGVCRWWLDYRLCQFKKKKMQAITINNLPKISTETN